MGARVVSPLPTISYAYGDDCNGCIGLESNAMLKLKFQKLHETVIRSVNADPVIDRLFANGIIGDDDMHMLQLQGSQRHQCRSLMALLHGSGNPQAFIELYLAVKEQRQLQWLAEAIDKFSDLSVAQLKEHEQNRQFTGFQQSF